METPGIDLNKNSINHDDGTFLPREYEWLDRKNKSPDVAVDVVSDFDAGNGDVDSGG